VKALYQSLMRMMTTKYISEKSPDESKFAYRLLYLLSELGLKSPGFKYEGGVGGNLHITGSVVVPSGSHFNNMTIHSGGKLICNGDVVVYGDLVILP
jgi:hypothetical protein